MDIVFTRDTYLQRLIPVGYNILLFFLKIFMESFFFFTQQTFVECIQGVGGTVGEEHWLLAGSPDLDFIPHDFISCWTLANPELL